MRPSPPQSIAVKTALAVASGTGQDSILDATGYVVARRQATVSAKITGKIAEVLIEEGQQVGEKQVLARLDPTDAKAQLQLAEATLAASRSQLEDLRVQLAQAQRELHRQEALAERRLTSEQLKEQARSAVDSLDARLATQALQVDVSRSALQVARVNLDNTVVFAPFAGVVVAKTAQPGEVVSPMSSGGFTRTGIGTIVDMDSLEIEVDVNEAFIGRVRPGQAIEARLNAYPDWAMPAEVIAIIPTADRSKATVKVRIGLLRKDSRLVPEMGVRVAFQSSPQGGETPRPGVVVPQAAIRRQAQVVWVFVVGDGLAHKRPVKLGEAQGGGQQILEGLRVGEQVVLDPPESLADGVAVIVE